MRGRKPKPEALRILEGRSPAHKTTATLPAKLLPPPDRLSAEAKAAWEVFAEQFFALGTLTEADAAALEVLSVNFAAWQAAITAGKEAGLVVKVNGQPVPNPYRSLATKLEQNVLRLLLEFGANLPQGRRGDARRVEGGSQDREMMVEQGVAA